MIDGIRVCKPADIIDNPNYSFEVKYFRKFLGNYKLMSCCYSIANGGFDQQLAHI